MSEIDYIACCRQPVDLLLVDILYWQLATITVIISQLFCDWLGKQGRSVYDETDISTWSIAKHAVPVRVEWGLAAGRLIENPLTRVA